MKKTDETPETPATMQEEKPVKQIPVLTLENYLESKALGNITLKRELNYGQPSITIVQRRYDSMTREPLDYVLPNITPQGLQALIDQNEEIRKNGKKNADGVVSERGTDEIERTIQSQKQSIEQMQRAVKQEEFQLEQRNEAFAKIHNELSVVLHDVSEEYAIAEAENKARLDEMTKNVARQLTGK